MRKYLAALFLSALVASPAYAQPLTLMGTADVLDSDLLMLDGHRVFLLGVESVEEGQICGIDNQPWECWPPAVRQLQTVAASGEMTCEVISGPNFLMEVIARCSVGGEDVGAQLVRSGFGLTIPQETDEYEDELAAAQAEGIGLWQGVFYTPAEWRALNNEFADRPTFRPVVPVP